MPLLHRPLTPAEVREIMKDWNVVRQIMKDRTWLNPEPIPHRVVYRHGQVFYVPPSEFFMSHGTHSPSDCEWIVPGTEQVSFRYEPHNI